MSESSQPTASANKKMTIRHILLAVGAIGIAALIYLGISQGFSGMTPAIAASSNQPDSSNSLEAPPIPVNLFELEYVDSIQQSRSYTGTIRAKRRSDLGFELAGRIISVFVDEGDRVQQGTVIAQLDTETLKAQRHAVVANLSQANSVLDELNAGPRIEKIKSAQADVAALNSEYDNAKLRLARRETLVKKNAIPVEEYDQAGYAVKTTKANLDAANERLAELKAGTRSEKISAQLATVDSLKASLEEIDVAINKSTLLAPYDATVTRRYVDPGSIAQPSTSVVKLVENDKLEAWVGLPVNIAAKANIGDNVYLNVNGNQVRAEVLAKIAEIDPVTRTQAVIYSVDPIDSKNIVSGQLCKIRITSRVETSGIWIPNSALNKGIRGLWSVMTVTFDDDGVLRVHKQDIEIVKTDSQRVLAKGTIKHGDRIVRNGVHRITDGQAVSDATLKQTAVK